MIRILHTIDTTGPGGAETVFLNLVKDMNGDRFHSTVVIGGPGWVCNELRKIGIEPIFINSKGSFNLRYLLDLVKIIRSYRIDIIQSHLLGSNLYSSLAGLLCGVPVVSTFHGFVDVNAKERFSDLKSKIINLGSQKIVFVSEGLREFYVNKKGFSPGKSVTIYNSIDTSIFKPQRDDSIRKQYGIGPENVLVGSVGNIRPAKGYDYLLRAAKMVVDKHPEFRFVVAGEGSGKLYDDLLILRKQLNLEKIFFFLGFISDIPKLMNNTDIFVLPSESEGFSISTIEAMACGLPVIATRCGGPEEIISHLSNGILVDNDSISCLSDSIIEIYINKSLRQNLVTNGLACVSNSYSNNISSGKYKSYYYNLLQNKRDYK